jgi:predicted DCC family thiol-disulfide oxidoreductase YuxK
MNATRPTHILLYDDTCPICTFQMRLLTWLDWRNAFSLLPISNPRATEIAPQLPREELLEAIHCVTMGGRIYRGARAIRYAGLRLPLLVPLALVLWIPGVIWVAEKVYQWVARNRYFLSRIFGCKEACALLPSRERANEKEAAGTPPHL